jgi:condensin-2 complex subunit H2
MLLCILWTRWLFYLIQVGKTPGVVLPSMGFECSNHCLSHFFLVHALADDSNPETQTFEELCRAHIQKFARGAEKYAAETQLSLRVGHWQERLSPLLQEEEQRPEFDIHAYGRTVIDSMEQEIRRHHPKSIDDTGIQDATENNTVDFQKVTRHCQQYEVCRMFLASLSLSNSGNVELVAERDDQCTSLQLSLVRKDIERPMETYFAPSAVEASASSLTTTAT